MMGVGALQPQLPSGSPANSLPLSSAAWKGIEIRGCHLLAVFVASGNPQNLPGMQFVDL